LLGGTKDDNLFQLPDLKEHLDLLESVGGNYIRNTMSSRPNQGFEVQPYKKLADGRYDLDQWNDEYWNRFENHYLSKKPRPINHVKIYGADSSKRKTSTTRHASECFWRNIIGGSASSRFHRPPYGLGLSKPGQAHIKSMRLLTAGFDIFNAVPDSKSRLLSNRGDNEAYLAYIPGKQYAVYFTDGGAVDLDLSDAGGSFIIRWLDIAKSQWKPGKRARTVKGGQKVTLRVPGKGYWAALIERR